MEWKRPVSGPAIVPADVSSQVRVTRADGTSVVIIEAMMRSDSITGYERSGLPANVALADVQTLEAWRLDPGFLFVPVIVAALIVVPRVLSRSLRGPSTGVTSGSE
jgi:hypothetical protein